MSAILLLKDGIVCQKMHICFFVHEISTAIIFLITTLGFFRSYITKENEMSTAQHKFEYANLWLFS